MPLVARRHLDGRFNRLVQQPDRIVAFEPWAQAVQDLPRLLERRLRHVHGAEPSRQRLVFLDRLLVFAQRCRADNPNLASREHRLERVRSVRRRPQRGTRTDHRVRFVDKQDQVWPLLELVNHVLDALLEHATQHRAGHERVHLQIYDLALAQPRRD